MSSAEDLYQYFEGLGMESLRRINKLSRSSRTLLSTHYSLSFHSVILSAFGVWKFSAN